MSAARVLFYAAGGGIGHVVRSLAVARRLVMPGRELRILTNCPFHHRLAAEGVPFDYVPSRGRSRDEVGKEFRRRIEAFRPELLVVDTFPRGLGDELPFDGSAAACRRILVARPRREPVDPAELSGYDRILVPEEDVDGLPRAEAVGPILVRDGTEIPSPDEAKELLRAEGKRVLLVGHHGMPGECERLFSLVNRLGLRLRRAGWCFRYAALRPLDVPVPPAARVDHFPLVELLPGVDLFVGAAGYNVFHELRAVAVPALFLPRSRRHDDQRARARRVEAPAVSPEAFEHRLAQLMEAIEGGGAAGERMWGRQPWPRGAAVTAAVIEDLVARGRGEGLR